MVKRRSLDDALTPEEEAFLGTESAAKPKTQVSKPKSKPKEEVPTMPRTAIKEMPSHSESPAAKEASAYATGASNGAINARIDPAITNALLRASFERRLASLTPHTQRDIIAEALADWLKKRGHLK